MDSNQRIEYLYKEYARLSEKVEENIKGSFDDFKLLGAASASIIVWKPIADLITQVNPKVNYSGLLFLGFLSLLLVFALIGFTSLIRTAYMFSIVSSLLSFEEEIRKELNEGEHSQVFKVNLERNTKKFSTAYGLTYGITLIILIFALTIIPFVVLCYFNVLYAVIYLLLALLVCIIYVQVARKLTRIFFDKFKIF